MSKVDPRNKVGVIVHAVSNRILSNHTVKNIYGNVNYAKTFLQSLTDSRWGGKNAVWKLTVDFKMPSDKPALGVELMRVNVHRQHFTLRTVLANELNQLTRSDAISNCLCISAASLSPCSHLAVASPPLLPPSSSSRPLSPLNKVWTATAIAIGIVVVIITVRAAATTDAAVPTAKNSAATVRAGCHRSRIGGPVGGVVGDEGPNGCGNNEDS